MYRDTIEKIRASVRESRMKPERKEEISSLLDKLSDEIRRAPDAAGSAEIAVSAKEPGRFRKFETEYPEATRIVNRICMLLSDAGL